MGKLSKKGAKNVRKYAQSIKKALVSQNKYTPDLEPMIKLAASAMRDWGLADEAIGNLDSITATEVTKYGEREVVHPAFKLIKDSRKQAAELLKHLGLTIDQVNTGDNSDELTRFDNMLDE